MTFDEWWKQTKPAECDELKPYFVEAWEIAATTEREACAKIADAKDSTALDDGLDAFSVKAPTTADFFILMVRYGDDYWSAHTTHRCIDDARKTAFVCSEANGQTAWRIVRVDGLPVNVPSGEV